MTPISPVNLDIRSDGVARLTVDQPNSRANTLGRAVWSTLADACDQLHGRSDVRGLLVRSGKDGMFLAGADLKELAALPIGDPAAAEEVVRHGSDVLAALESLPFPTAALIAGACLGGGLEVALACDFRLCGLHAKCRLGLPEVKLALIPGWGGTQRLPRIIGAERAARLICLGELLSADEATRIGLADEAVGCDQLEAAGLAQISQEAAAPSWATRRQRKAAPLLDRSGVEHLSAELSTLDGAMSALADDQRGAAETARSVIIDGCALPLPDALAVETHAFLRLVTSPSAHQRMQSFLKH